MSTSNSPVWRARTYARRPASATTRSHASRRRRPKRERPTSPSTQWSKMKPARPFRSRTGCISYARTVASSEELRRLGAGAVVAGDVDVPVGELGNGRDDLEVGRAVRLQPEGAGETVRVIGALRRHAAAVGDVDVQPAEDRIEGHRRPL